MVEISVPLKVIAYFRVRPVATSPDSIMPLPVKSTRPAAAAIERVPERTWVSFSVTSTVSALSATMFPAESSMLSFGWTANGAPEVAPDAFRVKRSAVGSPKVIETGAVVST